MKMYFTFLSHFIKEDIKREEEMSDQVQEDLLAKEKYDIGACRVANALSPDLGLNAQKY